MEYGFPETKGADTFNTHQRSAISLVFRGALQHLWDGNLATPHDNRGFGYNPDSSRDDPYWSAICWAIGKVMKDRGESYTDRGAGSWASDIVRASIDDYIWLPTWVHQEMKAPRSYIENPVWMQGYRKRLLEKLANEFSQ